MPLFLRCQGSRTGGMWLDARAKWIIHAAGRHRESAALLGSADGNHFMGCCWKNSHIMSLADMSRVDTPRDRIRGSFPGQV